LDTLEYGVRDTAGNATAAVTETVTQLGDAVQEAVASLKSAFDLEALVRRHPWPTLAGAVLAGFLLARLLPRGAPEIADRHSETRSGGERGKQ
jgi:ElaB/YqjD/DUF883 family membrane-anchored ribosome-binding protein